MKYHVVWEKDDEDGGVYYEDGEAEVPTEIVAEGEERVADWLSDKYGWLVFSMDEAWAEIRAEALSEK